MTSTPLDPTPITHPDPILIPPLGFSESRRRRPHSPPPTNAPNMPSQSYISFTPTTQRLTIRIALSFLALLVLRAIFLPSSSPAEEIQSHGVLERVLLADKYLDVSKYPFLQSRIGRDDRWDLFDLEVGDGIVDFWTRFQKPFITGKDTAHLDTQVMRTVIDNLLQFNGWVAAACPTLIRPFGQNNREDHYEDLALKDNLYYIAIVVHSADHFLIDQLAIIVQLARRLGTRNIFVSMLDMASSDSTPTLSDLSESVMTILGIAFRIRRVPPMTADPSATYYPLEEAESRNLALEPLHELWNRRSIKFHRVVWLKGFTCPNDVLETLRVSEVNNAAMVCGMDWAEHNGFFIFSDRWRTRDIEGNLFRQAKSNSKPEAGPPRDRIGTERYAGHLPFQVYCCESGTHVVDPEQSYYRDIHYRSSNLWHNLSTTQEPPNWDADTQCMDSTQMWFCRDLWTDAAKDGLKAGSKGGHRKLSKVHKRNFFDNLFDWTRSSDKSQSQSQSQMSSNEKDSHSFEKESNFVKKSHRKNKVEKREGNEIKLREDQQQDGGVNDEAGTDVDAIDEDLNNPALEPLKPQDLPASAFLIPNSAFTPARIVVNPRCVTTYGGVSHTQLALDLFGGERDEIEHSGGNYILDDWAGPPDSFVCQEMKTTGGRTAPKSQRRVGFLLQNEVSDSSHITFMNHFHSHSHSSFLIMSSTRVS
ncbi:capsular associated protein [Tremella mesenterica]|uniref:Capsular associated protein n=1 Tax=Tremella mesenterica TaxID=5217 RepID=A0A4Q1BUH9_TREME|nr:capsular associated protein [Tremella mesenterica]